MLKKIINIFSKGPSPEKEPDLFIQNAIKSMNEEVPSMLKGISLIKEKLMGLEKNLKKISEDTFGFSQKIKDPRYNESERMRLIEKEYQRCKAQLHTMAEELNNNQKAYVSAFHSLNVYIQDKKEQMHYALQFIEDKHKARWLAKLDQIMGKFDHFKNGQQVEAENLPGNKRSSTRESYVNSVLADAEQKINEIQALAETIASQEIKKTLTEIIHLVHVILSSIKDDSGKINQAKDFFIYYLDATLRIIRSYVSISQKNVHTNKIDQSLEKAETLLAKIKTVCEKQLDSFCEHEMLDLDTEMEVLERTIKLES